MESRKLDRLFRDKLERNEVEPSQNAWLEVQSRLEKKKKPVVIWYRVAAVITLLLVSGWMVFTMGVNQGREQVLTKVEQTAPGRKMEQPKATDMSDQAEDKTQAVQPAAKENHSKPVNKSRVNTPQTQVVTSQLAVSEVEEISEPVELLSVLDLDTKSYTTVASTQPTQVKIEPVLELETGVATNPAALDGPEEKLSLKKLWAKAQDIKPGELLANVRDTKAELLSLRGRN